MSGRDEIIKLQEEKLVALEKALFLETDASRKFALKKQIEELKNPFDDSHQHDDFLARVAQACKMREGEQVKIKRINKDFPYLDVVTEKEGLPYHYPIGVCEQSITIEVVKAFETQVLAEYRAENPYVDSYLIYRGDFADNSLIEYAKKQRIRLWHFAEYQNLLLNLVPYVQRQTLELANNRIYPPALYIEQRVQQEKNETQNKLDALSTLQQWVAEPNPRFIVVLGEFGTGKTFLLRELARRMGETLNAEKNAQTALLPLLLEMRQLEKTNDLDKLVAQQLAKEAGYDAKKFRYMLAQGKIVLLFDGFDELALRVSYDRVLEHFETLLEAARGDYAKVIVSSRKEHFINEKQIKLKLLEAVERVRGQEILYLQKFDNAQIDKFLHRKFEDVQKARSFYRLLNDIKDLMGLSENPRMLSFIVELPEADLRQAQQQDGEITAAKVYEMILTRWLEGEQKRVKTGYHDDLKIEQRWQAVEKLALHLWERTAKTVDIHELDGVTQQIHEELGLLLEFGIAKQQLCSGTLLIRDNEGQFGFIHQSVMEWLVAKIAVRQLSEQTQETVSLWQKILTLGNPTVKAIPLLEKRQMSALMSQFFVDLAGHDQARKWASRIIKQRGVASIIQNNADSTLKQLKNNQRNSLDRRGQNLRGQDFSGQDLRYADFSGADLTDALFKNAILYHVNFSNATLKNADFTKTDLSNANFSDADLTDALFKNAILQHANFSDATLKNADFTKTDLSNANFSDADLTDALFKNAILQHANFSDATLKNADFTKTDLSNANFTNAICDEVSLLGATVHQVNFSAKSWRRAKLLFVNPPELPPLNSPFGVALPSPHPDELKPEPMFVTGGMYQSVCFSPDDSLIAVAVNNVIQIWAADSGQCLRILEGHKEAVWSVAWRGDGAQVLSGSEDKSVRVWDVGSGQCLRILAGHESWVTSVAWRGDGAQVLSGSEDKSVRVWDVGSGQCLRILAGHTDRVWSVAWRGDGAQVLSGSSDYSVRVWDVGSGQCLRILAGHESWVTSVAWRGDGAQVLSGSEDKSVRVWDVGSGQCLRILAGHESWVTSVAWRGDGAQVLSGSEDKSVRVWDVGSGQCLRILVGHTDRVWSVAWRGDGAQVLSGSSDKSVRVWDVGSGQCLRILAGHESSVNNVAWRGDGAQVLSGSSDKSVRVWDVGSGQCLRILKGHTDTVWSVAWRGDGAQVLSGSEDNSVRVWDVSSGRCLRILAGHESWVTSVAWRGDGAQVLSGSSDKSVRVWDVGSGQCLRILWHEREITSVAWRNDDKQIISGSEDGTIRLWDAETGECLAVFIGLPDGWVSYSPKTGRYNYSGNVQGLFWYAVGLCRFELSELDEFMPELRLKAGEKLF
ncbi:NACHT domain-containing protein [Beggiatoa leptomitoformis]|uniref:NACHT domain-containing protein n=1 Tax=Beggiatoa leptomitoformis TaxID=288004 RepID=A0A2N9YFM7_9GAMM|nr:pentapeptide repeat-containing protein [Beggiatoa leptomitoformis]AUI69302.1 NACHT domain-containing protein [Beggiatoa leptomitoformis]